ncbi:sel1 repeat family protein [Marivibrio halodurans]|uniref:Sel1 repeat family protein n=1 Tax=Marivibrio halodurans TaxID=2039722 RepID=A0A8J7S0B5_9PROT|nr:sel1 repeat family protein [Marivibrio halodurans]MBP5858017.1 sel1 repeat family protein [Marivibrio halodurans]
MRALPLLALLIAALLQPPLAGAAEAPPPNSLSGSPPGPPSALAEAIAAYEAGAHDDAAALLEPLAAAGQAEAEYRLGLLLTTGRGGTLAIGRGLDWLDRAYRQGHNRAGLDHAATVIREDIRGPAADRAETILQALVECGMPAAMTTLGKWQLGRAPTEREQGVTLLREAAFLNDTAAQNRLGIALLRGESYRMGFAWLLLARNSGSKAARINLERAEKDLRDGGVWDEIERTAESLAKRLTPKEVDGCAR